jgi:hypothetical protein
MSSCHFRQGCTPFVRQRIGRAELLTGFADLRLIREVAVCAIVLCPVVHGKAVIHRGKQKANISASEFTQAAMDRVLYI